MIDPVTELRKRMAKGKLTQTAMSEQIGVSGPFLCLVLKGKRPPGPKILQYLGLAGTKVRRYERITSGRAPA